jgi:hypothetical protein
MKGAVDNRMSIDQNQLLTLLLFYHCNCPISLYVKAPHRAIT